MWHSASSCPFPRKRSCAQILGMFSNPPCPVEFGEGPHGAEQVALEGLRTVPAHPGLPGGAEAGPCSRPGTVLSWRMNPEPAPGQHPWLAGAVVQGTCSGQLAASSVSGSSRHLWPKGRETALGRHSGGGGGCVSGSAHAAAEQAGSRPGCLKGRCSPGTSGERSARLVVTAGPLCQPLLGGGWDAAASQDGPQNPLSQGGALG